MGADRLRGANTTWMGAESGRGSLGSIDTPCAFLGERERVPAPQSRSALMNYPAETVGVKRATVNGLRSVPGA
jgi:hypothetical protein